MLFSLSMEELVIVVSSPRCTRTATYAKRKSKNEKIIRIIHLNKLIRCAMALLLFMYANILKVYK